MRGVHVASERTRGDAAVFALLLRVVLRDGDEERGERKTSMSDVSSGISSSSGSDLRFFPMAASRVDVSSPARVRRFFGRRVNRAPVLWARSQNVPFRVSPDGAT